MKAEGRVVEKLTVEMFKPGNEIILVGERRDKKFGKIHEIRVTAEGIVFEFSCSSESVGCNPSIQWYSDLSFPAKHPIEKQLSRRRTFLIFQEDKIVWKYCGIKQFRLVEGVKL